MIKGVNSILLYVVNPHASADFYKKLGLEILKEDGDICIVKTGGFTIQCFNQTKSQFKVDNEVKKGEGVFIYLQVEDVDAVYKELINKGLTPSGEPKDWEWGNREFVIKDPDGYKIVAYQPI